MMSLSPRKFAVIKAVCDYYTLTRPMVQALLGVRNDRVMRGLLQELYAGGFIQKTRVEAVNAASGNPAPVWFPSRKGAELVAAETGDERYLRVVTRTPTWMHLWHWLEVAEFHIRLDQAVAMQPAVRLLGWFGEWDEINPQSTKPEERYRLYTVIREKPSKIVCAPDAAFALAVGPHSKTYYLELDRATSGLQQIASSKSPGYAGLANGGLHRRHFETTTESFTVLHLSPTPARRDQLRQAFASKEGAALHWFASFADWTPERALTEPIFVRTDSDEPRPLIRLPQGGSA